MTNAAARDDRGGACCSPFKGLVAIRRPPLRGVDPADPANPFVFLV